VRWPLWNLGFRPFYLFGSIFGAAGILLWTAQYSGLLPFTYLRGTLWHGHEMLFGFTMAVVAGFLLTAVRAWTGRQTAVGALLVSLVVLWAAGRVLVLTPLALPAAVLNAAFPLVLAAVIAVPLVRARNLRNLPFVGLLLVMGGLVALLHLGQLGALAVDPRLSLVLGLDVMLFIMAVIGGRVIPMFTNNGIPGAGATRHALIEKAALGSLLALLAADALETHSAIKGAIALVAAASHGWRLLLWRPWRTARVPLVWILHAAYAWIVAHLALRALAGFAWLPELYATHALTIGAIGGLTLGMMVRSARGHTGRALAADRWEIACFVLVQAAALVRVFGGMALPAWYLQSVQISGLLWTAAYSMFAVRYWPILTRPRVDGKPG
jgi:uncharacterized protein involved in response to NO